MTKIDSCGTMTGAMYKELTGRTARGDLLVVEKKVYSMDDMVEQDLSTAPSLDLPALRIEKFFMPKDGGKMMLFFANVRKDWRPADGCPICQSNEDVVASGRTKPRIIRDVVRNNYCVQIVLQSPRLMCNACQHRFVPKIDGIVPNGSMTQRLLDFVKTESFLQPHLKIAERTGLSITTIQNIMDSEIDRYEKIRAENPMPAPRVLGIDEKHIANMMRGTLVDVENGNLLDMTEDNNEETLREAIMKLDGWDENIEVVTTDMANRYLRWMPGLLPNATFVIDKFHVIQDVQRKVNSAKKILYPYRKEIIDNIEDKEEQARQRNILRIVNNNKRLFNYSIENIIRDDTGRRALKLDTIMNEFPEYRLLRMLYFYVEDMYTKETRKEAEEVWDEWQEILPPTGKKDYQKWCELYDVDEPCFEAFKSLSRSGFLYYKEYILNYFNPGCRHTNAVTEGLNSLIGQINISGNGYRFRHLRAKALYASLIHERVLYSMDMRTIQAWKPTINFQGHVQNFNTSTRWQTTSSTTYSYSFGKSKRKCDIPQINVLTDAERLKNSLECSGPIEPIPDSDEDTVVNKAWKHFEPNEITRKILIMLEEDEE